MNIAVFLPNWIGDVVMATPTLRALRRHFHNDHVVGVLRPYVADVLAGSPWFNDVLFDDGCLKTSLSLRRRRIDVAILLTNSFRSSFMARLGGCRKRIGYDRDGRGWLLTHRVPPRRDARGNFEPSPIIDAYLLLATKAGSGLAGYHLELSTTDDDERAAEGVWNQFRLATYPEVVCLNPGAAFGSAKHWPVSSFATLAAELVDRRGAAVLVLCGPAERDMAREIVRLSGRPGVHSLADETLNIGLTKACIQRADLLVTTDSGPRHFAAAFQTPVVTLFGPTHIAWTETYYRHAVHLQQKVECGPCQKRVCPLDHRCMTLLTPAQVFAAAAQLLDRGERRRKAS